MRLLLQREPFGGHFQIAIGIGKIAGLELLAEALPPTLQYKVDHRFGNELAPAAFGRHPIEDA